MCLHQMCSLVMSSCSHDFLKKLIQLTCVQYLYGAWFLDGKHPKLVFNYNAQLLAVPFLGNTSLTLILPYITGCHKSSNYYLCYSVGAVYRYYESRRRIVNDAKPVRAEAVRANKQKSRKIALRKQVLFVLT